MTTLELPMMHAGIRTTIPKDTVGSFYDFTSPCVVVALEASTLELVYPHTRQTQEGIEVWFDTTFSGGKIKVMS